MKSIYNRVIKYDQKSSNERFYFMSTQTRNVCTYVVEHNIYLSKEKVWVHDLATGRCQVCPLI